MLKRKKTKISTYFVMFIVLLQNIACAQNTNNENTFKAGASMASVTPPDGSKLLNGKKVHDPLYAKSLVLDDGTTKIAFVVVDNQGIPAYIIDAAKKKIQQQTEIPVSNIVVSSTHTHSGISAGNAPINLNKGHQLTEYQQLLIDKIAESVSGAFQKLQPAVIGWGSFDKPDYVFNRRWYMKKTVINPFGLSDSVKTNPGYTKPQDLSKPAGPVDPQVSFIAVKTTDGQPISVFANYSTHYIGGVGKNEISADYYGEFGRQLATLLGVNDNQTEPSFVGIMSNGTSGDVNANDYSTPKSTLKPYQKINLAANDIAKNVVDQMKKITFQDWVPLKVSNQEISLNLRTPSTTMSANMLRASNNKRKTNLFNKQEKKYATRAANFEKRYPKTSTFTLQAFTIGDLAVATIPFEVFAETGLDLKKRNPFQQSFTIGLANGHWGYLPTPQQHKKGGYESWFTINRVQEDASDLITNNLLKQFNNLKE